MSLYRQQFTNTVYNVDVMLCVGTIEEFKRYMLSQFPSIEDEVRWRNSKGKTIEHTVMSVPEYAEWFLWLPTWEPNNHAHILTLSHECQHLTFQILRKVGITLTRESEEAFTYLSAAFMFEFWTALDKKFKKARKRRTR